MFNTNTIKETKRKINLTINPTVYRTFSEIAEKRLQPKSWIIESMMKNYITINK
jgi:predicted transcriptional regulator